MKTKTSGLNCFLKGLLCFFALGYDFLQGFIDKLIFGDAVADNFFDSPWFVLVTHWIFVIIVWTITAFLLIKWINKNSNQQLLQLKWNSSLTYLIPCAIIASVALAYLEQLIDPAMIPQIYREFLNFKADHGSMGIVVSVAQNVYYVVESCLVLLLIILMQLAGESWFKKRNIPWGAIGLLLTWGLGHLTHGGLATLWICMFALFAGVFYLLAKRHVVPSYIIILLIFII